MLKYDKTYYRRNILISIIISEILVISAFVLSPRESTHNTKIIISDPVILYDDIPQTIQRSAEPAPPPQIPPINITEEIEAYQTLDDVAVIQSAAENGEESSDDHQGDNHFQYVRSAPRLLYEVVPAGGEDDYHGRLQLSLKIDEDGRVIDHRILYNSLDCPDCLNNLIKAAYKSKWEPAVVNGIREDYWVVKSYTFN